MSNFDPKSFIKNYLDEARPLGKANELSWLDFKRDWHQMKTDDGKLEFLKDAAALANTGQDALMVFGVEDKTFAFKNQRIGDSQYVDASSFQSLVASRISPSFSLEVGELEYDDGTAKHALSFVHVPPTRNRPHIVAEWKAKGCAAGAAGPPTPMRTFKNALFFRRGPRTFGPTCDEALKRTELDAMYIDRASPPSRLRIRAKGTFARDVETFNPEDGQPATGLGLSIIIENLGFASNSISEVWMEGTAERTKPPGTGQVVLPRRLMLEAHEWGRGEHQEVQTPIFLRQGRAWEARAHFGYLPDEWSALGRGKGEWTLRVHLEVVDIFGSRFAEAATFFREEPENP